MTDANVPVWPDLSDPKTRKCPRHKAWVQAQQSMGVIKSRYCPRCEVEKAAYEKHKQALAGVDKPKIIIRKI